MVSEARQRVMEANRSLRNIKNELESLLEKGVITEDVFDSISRQLPTETSIAAGSASSGLPTPASSATNSPAPPTGSMGNLSLNAPPSYSQSTGGGGGGAPPLPGRNQPPPSKPVLVHARALYTYSASDARDVGFDKDDGIAVYEYMNADWWMGRNERTGQEGIFPKNYVEVDTARTGPAADWNGNGNGNGNGNEKVGGYPGASPYQPMYGTPVNGAYPQLPPPQGNPYNANVPPMAVAQQGDGQAQQGGGSKTGEMGKKFGKKLGNAAIFGAGATIGSNIVNSIF